MLFHVEWDFVDQSEEATKRSLAIFGAWQPPEGFEFRGFYQYADSSGGFAIVEAASAEALTRASSTFAPWLRFSIVPIVEIEQAVAIENESMAFRDSIA